MDTYLEQREVSQSTPQTAAPPKNPFVNAQSFATTPPGANPSQIKQAVETVSSPFTNIRQTNGNAPAPNTEQILISELSHELYDREFESALLTVMETASDRMETELDGSSFQQLSQEADHIVNRYLEPLLHETEVALNHLIPIAEQIDRGEEELPVLEHAIDHYVATTPLEPEIEDFFKKAFRKIKRGVKKVGRAIKKGARRLAKATLGKLLRRLKKYARKLIMAAVKRGLRFLPKPMRPLAKRVARRLMRKLKLREIDSHELEEAQFTDSFALGEMQSEFDAQLISLLLNENELEWQNSASDEGAMTSIDSLDELEFARQRFTQQLVDMDDEAKIVPAVESFIPAILPAVKLGIKIIGRKKVIRVIARAMGAILRRFGVPKQFVKPLSGALANAGLRLVNLESPEEEQNVVASQALAMTVEDAVRQIAALPENILDDEVELEAQVLIAFERAATSNFPSNILPDQEYERRPELRESTRTIGSWMVSRRRKRKAYKKFSKRINVTITPHNARAIKSFGGRSLWHKLKKRLKKDRAHTIRAEMELFELLPGGTTASIATQEQLVGSERYSSGEHQAAIHPLTPQAAGLLMQEPGLGRQVPQRYLSSPRRSCVGQRFYVLHLPDDFDSESQVHSALPPNGEAHLQLDFPTSQLHVALYLDENQSQRLSQLLAASDSTTAAVSSLRPVLAASVNQFFHDVAVDNVRVVHGAIAASQANGSAMNMLPKHALQALRNQLIEWSSQALQTHLDEQRGAISNAANDSRLGLTLKVHLGEVPDLKRMNDALSGNSIAVRGQWFSGTPKLSSLSVAAGYTHGN